MEIDREHFSDNDDSPMVSNFVWQSCVGMYSEKMCKER